MSEHNLDNVRQRRARVAPAERDASSVTNLTGVTVDAIARQLVTLVDLGRAIVARNAVAVIPDNELDIAGQRVEHIAERLYRAIFGEAPR